MDQKIIIRGARTHNLKSIQLELPRNQLIVITGPSGSGKSSLAFDTLYAEGQRRYVESLSSYARQFLSMMSKPDVDLISGLSPSIAIEQKTISHNPRSTVGTITEIYDYLRLLYARVGTPHCPEHGCSLEAQSITQMVNSLIEHHAQQRICICAPLVRDRKGEYVKLLDKMMAQGYARAWIDGEYYDLGDTPTLDPKVKHGIDIVVDRLVINAEDRQRLTDSLESTVALSKGLVHIRAYDDAGSAPLEVFSTEHACPVCGYSVAALEPRLFSFNNPIGACEHCEGLGTLRTFDPELVVHHKELSVAGGAIRGYDRKNHYFIQWMEALSEALGFSLDTPYGELAEDIQQILLYGSGKQRFKFKYFNLRGRGTQYHRAFEGIIPMMQRRYEESESQAVKEELSKYLSFRPCPHCQGTRLKTEAQHVLIHGQSISSLCQQPIDELKAMVASWQFEGAKKQVAERILKEINDRLHFLVAVGLNYLTLERPSETLSGGESQRIRLASQIGSGLVGVTYILDEPSIGLHARDNDRLITTLKNLRDMGNTVIVVEHDEEAMRAADYLVDFGPGSGIHGGEVIAAGTPKEVMATKKSLTGQYLCGKKSIAVPTERRAVNPEQLIKLQGVCCHNLNKVDISFPIGLITCVTGVSGSGKSSLVNDTLYPEASNLLNGSKMLSTAAIEQIDGLEALDKVIAIDQAPIGRTPRSNPATYTGILGPVRDLFAQVPESRARGYAPGRFSFNVKGGRCEHCEGDGMIKVEMHFLSDIYVTCDHCRGQRYNEATLEITYKGKNIAEVLAMTVEEACTFFEAIPAIQRKCQTLMDVGLGYISLGQSATTLSGGEAQRIKLARELSKRQTGRTLYILDEPTTGLHFADIQHLLNVLKALRAHGNTLVIVEHNLDVIKTADWIIDMGPEGGKHGGQVIATGTPEQVATVKKSYTGQHLKKLLSRR